MVIGTKPHAPGLIRRHAATAIVITAFIVMLSLIVALQCAGPSAVAELFNANAAVTPAGATS